MKLLVTGGSGFIGSNFIHYWLEKYPKDKIINLDKLTYAGHNESLRDIKNNSNYKFAKGDIVNRNVVDSVMSTVDVVVNFAAETHVDRSILDPSTFIKTNVLGTYVLLEYALKYKIKRFHHISTDEVFGSLDLNFSKKFSEDTKYNPSSPYSASKAASDHLVKSYFHTFGLPISITNCTNNFGPYQDPEKFLPRLITNLIDGKKIPIYGDGLNVRDWLYVIDHAKAIDLVIHNGKIGDTYVVGGMTKNFSNLDIAHSLLKIFNLNDSYISFVKDRPGHDRRYAVNWKRINKELEWKPEYDFNTYLLDTVKWYKENEWWWRPLKEKSESIYK